MSDRKTSTQKLVTAALFLAIGMILPFVTGQIPAVGKALLPMHIPVLLCGFICGWPYGLIVGVVLPLLRSVVFGMPVLYPTALSMAVELAVYGFVTGFLYHKLKKGWGAIYLTLLIAMLTGRIAWGLASVGLFAAVGDGFTWKLFVAQGFLNAIPGIVIQLLLIPVLVKRLER